MSDSTPHLSLWQRLHQVFGPLFGTAILDGLDLATFGRLGLLFGGIVGAVATWMICAAEDVPIRTRMTLCALAALYCAFPFTEFIPLATIILGVARFFKTPSTTPSLPNTPGRVKHVS